MQLAIVESQLHEEKVLCVTLRQQIEDLCKKDLASVLNLGHLTAALVIEQTDVARLKSLVDSKEKELNSLKDFVPPILPVKVNISEEDQVSIYCSDLYSNDAYAEFFF